MAKEAGRLVAPKCLDQGGLGEVVLGQQPEGDASLERLAGRAHGPPGGEEGQGPPAGGTDEELELVMGRRLELPSARIGQSGDVQERLAAVVEGAVHAQLSRPSPEAQSPRQPRRDRRRRQDRRGRRPRHAGEVPTDVDGGEPQRRLDYALLHPGDLPRTRLQDRLDVSAKAHERFGHPLLAGGKVTGRCQLTEPALLLADCFSKLLQGLAQTSIARSPLGQPLAGVRCQDPGQSVGVADQPHRWPAAPGERPQRARHPPHPTRAEGHTQRRSDYVLSVVRLVTTAAWSGKTKPPDATCAPNRWMLMTITSACRARS